MNVKRLYVFDSQRHPIFIHEKYIQGSGMRNHGLFTNIITALQSFAKEIGTDELNGFEIGEEKMLSMRDKSTQFYFMIARDKDTREKTMNTMLHDIKNLFIEKCKNHVSLSEEIKREMLRSFREDLKKLLESRDQVEFFLRGF